MNWCFRLDLNQRPPHCQGRYYLSSNIHVILKLTELLKLLRLITSQYWWAMMESNHRHFAYQTNILTTELIAHYLTTCKVPVEVTTIELVFGPCVKTKFVFSLR